MIRGGAFVALLRVEVVVHLAVEIVRALIPRARSDEGPILKPFWAVVSKRSASKGSRIKIPVRTIRRGSDVTGLSAHCRGIGRETDPHHRGQRKKNNESLHGAPPSRSETLSVSNSTCRQSYLNSNVSKRSGG